MMIDTDSEDELPSRWEERVMTDGRVYYANHDLKTTQWTHPVSNKRKTVSGELPYGWERRTNEDEYVYYVDHINKKTTYTDPRLAFAVEDKGDKTDIRQKFDSSTSAKQILLGRDLSKRYVIITGGNSGIGYETALTLALHGAHVTLACSSMERAKAAEKRIKERLPAARVHSFHCDLSSLTSVNTFVQQYLQLQWPLHILVLNAAVFGLPYSRTEDGFEKTFQVNYLSQFYLTTSMIDLMKSSTKARIVIVGAESHRLSTLTSSSITTHYLSPTWKEYNYLHAYNNSKLCLMLFTRQLHEHLQNLRADITVNIAHPGNLIYTGLTRHCWLTHALAILVRPFAKSTQQGAATIMYCAVARELDGTSGRYYNNCTLCPMSTTARSDTMAKILWTFSEQLVQKGLAYAQVDEPYRTEVVTPVVYDV